MSRIAVIGGGPAGCTAAYDLHRRGHKVTLFESDVQVGGRTQGYRSDGHVLDTGAAFFTNFYPRMRTLLIELGLEAQIQPLHRITGLQHDSELAHLNISSALSFLRFPFVGLVDKIRMIKWMAGLTLRRRHIDLAEPQSLSQHDHQTVGDYARDRLSETIYHLLIRPGIEPFWYFSCEEISEGLLIALSSWAAGAKFYRLNGGIDLLCRRLIDEVTVHTQTKVTRLKPAGDGLSVRFTSPDGDAETLDVDRVIVATPAHIAHQLVQSLDDSLVTADQLAFLSSQQYVSNLHVAFSVDQLNRDPQCSSILPCGEGLHDFAALSFHRVGALEDGGLISLYLPAHESDRLMKESDERVYEHCAALIDRVAPEISSPKRPFHLVRRSHAIPVHEVGRYRGAVDFQADQATRALQFCGDYLATATIEGAIATGLKASQNLSALL